MKRILLVLLVLLLTISTVGCTKTIKYANGNVKYKGEWKGGMANGKGFEYYEDEKEKYNGSFKEGKYDGLGILSYPNGDKYEGDFKQGILSGNGTMTYSDGTSYNGTFEGGYYKKGSLLSQEGIIQSSGQFSENNTTLNGTKFDTQGNPIFTGKITNGRYLSGSFNLSEYAGDELSVDTYDMKAVEDILNDLIIWYDLKPFKHGEMSYKNLNTFIKSYLNENGGDTYYSDGYTCFDRKTAETIAQDFFEIESFDHKSDGGLVYHNNTYMFLGGISMKFHYIRIGKIFDMGDDYIKITGSFYEDMGNNEYPEDAKFIKKIAVILKPAEESPIGYIVYEYQDI